MNHLSTPAEIDLFLTHVPKERIVSRECKHATYVRHRGGEQSDALIIKEWVTLDDGMRLPRLRTVENYKRPYWVTKQPFRTHPDKIQFEELSRLDMFRVPQCKLRQDICFRIGGTPNNPMKVLARSPYLYGLDVGPEVFMKQSYTDKWPNAFIPNRVSVIDAETDVNSLLHPKIQLPILWSLVSDDEIVLYVNKSWTFDIDNYAEQIHKEYQQVIGQWAQMIRDKMTNKKGEFKGQYPEWVDQIEKIPLSVQILPNDFDITKAMVDRLHETQPDLVTGWNVFFDAKCIENSVLNAGKDLADVMSDPRVAYKYRGAQLTEGPATKKTANGREMRLDPQECWNKILNTASWRMQDMMQLYWQLRKAKGKESGGYSLDAVLDRQLSAGKLKYETEDTSVPSGTLHWHMDMQRNYKVRYGVYNIIDSMACWVLDKKNQDLSSQISSLAGPLDYSNFNSQPKINVTDMLFSTMRKLNKVICSTSDQMADDNDALLSDKSGWIITFPSHIVTDTGLFLFEDMPEVRSMIHMFNADADVETTYPISEIIQNLSSETTVAEPCQVLGVGREALRLASINLTGGRSNSIEIIETICKMPMVDEWLTQARIDFPETQTA